MAEMQFFFVDISETVEIKINSLKAHKSQVRSPNSEFEQFIRNMAITAAQQSEYTMAEAFRYFYLGEDDHESNPVREN